MAINKLEIISIRYIKINDVVRYAEMNKIYVG
jgi:hypothetical protein